VAYQKVAEVLLAQGKPDEALERLHASLAIAERLATATAATPNGSVRCAIVDLPVPTRHSAMLPRL
jgi:hypothetical protein